MPRRIAMGDWLAHKEIKLFHNNYGHISGVIVGLD